MENMKKIIWISVGLMIVLVILGIGFPYYYLSTNRTYQRVSIPANGYELNGYLSIGSEPEGLWIILTHGNRKIGQSHELYRQIRENLPNQYSVLAIDFRGFGESSNVGLEQSKKIIDRIIDIESAVKFLNHNSGVREDQIVLIGHSLGASQVMSAAVDHEYRQVIPIGLGDWDSVLADPKKIESYSQKYFANTGVLVSANRILAEGKQFSTKSLFANCPDTPVWLIFSSRDDGLEPLSPILRKAHALCGQSLQWSIIPFANHMYGTEIGRLPDSLAKIVSRINLSFLMMRLNHILYGIQ